MAILLSLDGLFTSLCCRSSSNETKLKTKEKKNRTHSHIFWKSLELIALKMLTQYIGATLLQGQRQSFYMRANEWVSVCHTDDCYVCMQSKKRRKKCPSFLRVENLAWLKCFIVDRVYYFSHALPEYNHLNGMWNWNWLRMQHWQCRTSGITILESRHIKSIQWRWFWSKFLLFVTRAGYVSPSK